MGGGQGEAGGRRETDGAKVRGHRRQVLAWHSFVLPSFTMHEGVVLQCAAQYFLP